MVWTSSAVWHNLGYCIYMAKKQVPGAGENPSLAAAMLGKRLSSAAGKHKDKRTKRARTRAAAKERQMKDWD